MGESRIVQGALHFLVLGGLLFAASTGFGMGTAMVNVHNASDVEAFLKSAGVASWMMLSYGLVLFAVAVSRLTFESDNHAFWPRLSLFVHFAGNAALCYGIQLLATPSPKELMGMLLGVLGLIHAFVAALFVATGKPGLSKRVRENPPRFNPLGLLLPGAARGLGAGLFLIAAFTGASVGLLALSGGADEKTVGSLLLLCAFAVLYLAVPVALGRGPLRAWMPGSAFLQVLAVLIFVAGVGVPPLVALVGDFKVDDPVINFLNPIVSVVKSADSGPGASLPIVTILALGAVFAALQVSRARDQEADSRG